MDLQTLLQKKATIESQLENLEQQIYQLEGNYLQDTHQYGNVVLGWGNRDKKQKFKESDRIFSKSSSTSSRSLGKLTKKQKGVKNSQKKSVVFATDLMDLDM